MVFKHFCQEGQQTKSMWILFWQDLDIFKSFRLLRDTSNFKLYFDAGILKVYTIANYSLTIHWRWCVSMLYCLFSKLHCFIMFYFYAYAWCQAIKKSGIADCFNAFLRDDNPSLITGNCYMRRRHYKVVSKDICYLLGSTNKNSLALSTSNNSTNRYKISPLHR